MSRINSYFPYKTHRLESNHCLETGPHVPMSVKLQYIKLSTNCIANYCEIVAQLISYMVQFTVCKRKQFFNARIRFLSIKCEIAEKLTIKNHLLLAVQ